VTEKIFTLILQTAAETASRQGNVWSGSDWPTFFRLSSTSHSFTYKTRCFKTVCIGKWIHSSESCFYFKFLPWNI